MQMMGGADRQAFLDNNCQHNKSAFPSGGMYVGVHLLWFENNINRGTEK